MGERRRAEAFLTFRVEKKKKEIINQGRSEQPSGRKKKARRGGRSDRLQRAGVSAQHER